MSLRSFSGQIELNAPAEKVFQHYTDTDELASLMPGSFRVKILRRATRHLNQGVSLEIELRLWGMPIRWKAHIQSFSKGRHIAWIWRRGGFSMEHNDYFEQLPNNQCRLTSCVLYSPPLGPLGSWVDRLMLRPKIHRIFEHRKKLLFSLFQAVKTEKAPSREHSKAS